MSTAITSRVMRFATRDRYATIAKQRVRMRSTDVRLALDHKPADVENRTPRSQKLCPITRRFAREHRSNTPQPQLRSRGEAWNV
mmetsp:Transcript_4862/g.10380  ORF Transcript_4862/g.10380 Transcript_4862/m.10380 type:complete len:84 (+) Transcript_4862:112-363(+)